MTQVAKGEKISEKLDDKNEFMQMGESRMSKKKEEEGEQIKESKQEEVQVQESEEELETDYRLPELVDYFGKKEINKNNYQSMVNHLVKLCHSSFKEQIQTGYTRISPDSKELADYTKANQSKQQKQQKQLSRSRIGELEPPPDHKEFIQRMSKVRRVTEKKRKMKLEYDQSRRESELKKSEEKRKEEEEKRRLEKERIIKEKMEEAMKKKEKDKEERIQAIKRYKSVLSQKRRHELMAEKYEKNIKQPLLQERNKILEERSKKFKGYSIDEIKVFQREYIRKEEERASLSRKSKEQWEYTPPAIHPRLYQILEEQKIKERIKMEEKKRALEEKISRKQYYAQYLKETISVKVDEKKKLELERLNAKQPPRGKSKSEAIKIGNNYLHEAKSLAKYDLKDKKQTYSTQQQPRKSESIVSKMKSNTSMGSYGYDKTIKQAHEQKINRLISSQSIEKGQKLKQLKFEVDKLTQMAKRKQQLSKINKATDENDTDLDLLLSSIKAKIGIMHIYKK